MADQLFTLEKFLSETERRAYREAVSLYPDNPELSERIGRLVREIQRAKAAVVASVRQATAA